MLQTEDEPYFDELVQGRGEVLCPETSAVFPEGFGIRVKVDSGVCIQGLIRRSHQEVTSLLKRFGLIVFPETSCYDSSPRSRSPLNQFHSFHLDGDDFITGPQVCEFVHAMLHPLAPPANRDATHFVEAQDYAQTLARVRGERFSPGYPAWAYLNDKGAQTHDTGLLRGAFQETRMKYAHDWDSVPCSSVLYFPGRVEEGRRVFHGRLYPNLSLGTAAHRLKVRQIDREFLGTTLLR